MVYRGVLTEEQVNWYEAKLPLAERKKRGHFSTPPLLVEQILDACGYTPDAGLSGVRVLDPACGSGNFLAGAARRLVAFSKRSGLSRAEQVDLVQRNLWGFDPDPVSCFLAEMQLHGIVHFDGISKQRARLHIHQADSLIMPWGPCIDLFVANPPYLAMKNNDLSGYRSALGRGQADSYLLFVSLALQAVRPGGWIGLVLPDPVLARANAARERDRLLKEATLHHLWHLSGVFAAEVGAVVLIAQKCPPKRLHHVSWLRERWRSTPLICQQRVEQALFLRQPGAELRYLLDDGRGAAIERLQAALENERATTRVAPTGVHDGACQPAGRLGNERAMTRAAPTANRRVAPLGEFLSISRGEELGRESSYLSPEMVSQRDAEILYKEDCIQQSYHSRGDPCDRPGCSLLAPDFYPVLRGGVDIHPYCPPVATWCIARQAVTKPLERYLAPKLLVVKSTERLQATLDLQGHVVLQTLYILHARDRYRGEDDLYFFLALLNSRLLREYVYLLHTAYKWVQPQIEQRVLAQLPIPIVRAEEKYQIVERSRALVHACSELHPVVEWNERITGMYEEQERAVCALYASVLPGLFDDKGVMTYG